MQRRIGAHRDSERRIEICFGYARPKYVSPEYRQAESDRWGFERLAHHASQAEAWEKAGSFDPEKTVEALLSIHHKGVVSDGCSSG